jgi:hypothetical protein
MRFPDLGRDLVDLDIEDRWYRGDAELVRRLLTGLAPHLGPPERAPARGKEDEQLGRDAG